MATQESMSEAEVMDAIGLSGATRIVSHDIPPGWNIVFRSAWPPRIPCENLFVITVEKLFVSAGGEIIPWNEWPAEKPILIAQVRLLQCEQFVVCVPPDWNEIWPEPQQKGS